MPVKPLRLYSWNVNGIRACLRHGFLDWLRKTQPDVLCLQEIKADADVFPKELHDETGYHLYLSHADKKGYAGVAVLTKTKPLKVIDKLGVDKFDHEGRFLLLEFEKFYLCNTYFPNSQPELVRLDFKQEFNAAYLKLIQKFKDKPVILTGDFNVAHQEIDLARPKANTHNAGFTLEERAFVTNLISAGWIDTFRELHPQTVRYSWFSYRFGAREKNLGWRIDYFFVPAKLRAKIKSAEIYDQTEGSDHCPVGLDIIL